MFSADADGDDDDNGDDGEGNGDGEGSGKENMKKKERQREEGDGTLTAVPEISSLRLSWAVGIVPKQTSQTSACPRGKTRPRLARTN